MSGFRTMSGAIKAHKKAGGYFFSKEALDFFSGQIHHDTYQPETGLFITSEVFGDEYLVPRTYAVRHINLDNPRRIDNVGERHETLQQAQDALLRAHREMVTER